MGLAGEKCIKGLTQCASAGNLQANLRVAMPFSSFLLLVVRPGATSSVLATSSNALVTSSVLVPSSDARSP